MKRLNYSNKLYHAVGMSFLVVILTASLIQMNGCSQLQNKGFSVETFDIDRPFWKIFTDDIDGDGKPEIVACDVDGIVTVRNRNQKVMLNYNAGALVYQFEAADLNNDGVKEVIISSVDPKAPLKAIDLNGNVIQVFAESAGPERLATGDLNNDGNVEIAVSIANLLDNRGTSAGLRLYDNKGNTLWTKNETIREFHIADLIEGGFPELVVGDQKTIFRVYNLEGTLLETVTPKNGFLDHFVVTDVDGDGKSDIVASYEATPRTFNTEILCVSNDSIIWDIKCPDQLRRFMWDYSGVQLLLSCSDFDKKLEGKETILIGSNYLYMFDSKGNLIYQNREGFDEYWQTYVPEGINPMDIATWDSSNPELYISSSRFRDNAWYSLTYGKEDEYRAYRIPDQEICLDSIYRNIKKQAIAVNEGDQKIKIFMEMHPKLKREFSTATEESLMQYRLMLDSMDSEHLEYLVVWEVADVESKKSIRGDYLPSDQIIERAKLFEKAKIPFGFWTGHAGRFWLSDTTIQKCKEAAPEMLRFLLVVENLEAFYGPGYKKWLETVKNSLDFCAANNMKMIFKDKHDIWSFIADDKEVAEVLFNPKYKGVFVPAFSTNQPFHFEAQLGGLLGLKKSGLCEEFGISSQFWNYHEWGGYYRGMRDITPAMVCPNDIILRLDLMGIALGATWINLEHGQPYFRQEIKDGLSSVAYRHREINFELIRKNIIQPGQAPLNLNTTAVVRSLHPEFIKAKEKLTSRIYYPHYERNIPELRTGFIPSVYQFETNSSYSFPMIGYSSVWNPSTCFPQTPNGWIQIVTPKAKLPGIKQSIYTDGNKIMLDNNWVDAENALNYVENAIKDGAEEILFEAPGTCFILHTDGSSDGSYRAILLDPGYLAPVGVITQIKPKTGSVKKATDMVTGEVIEIVDNSIPVNIQPGAFRIVKIEMDTKN